MILVLLFILSSGFILFKSKNKLYTLTIFYLTLILILILLNPELCISCAHKGIKLFFSSVFPSLFPFTVITSLILSFNGVSLYSKLFGSILCKPLKLPKAASFPLIVSLICGFPLGAKYTGALNKDGVLNDSQATTTLIAASNASPLFVIGVVGAVLFKNVYIGYLLFGINIAACYIGAFFFSSKKRTSTCKSLKISLKPINIGNSIRSSIESALNTTLIVCSYITFFSIMIGYINHYVSLIIPQFNSIWGKFILGLIELTNGVTIISSSQISLYSKLIMVSFLISFSGLSIFSQVYSLVYDKGLSFKIYFIAKIFQGFISSILTLIVLIVLNLFNLSSFVFHNITFISTYSSTYFYIPYGFLIASFIISAVSSLRAQKKPIV